MSAKSFRMRKFHYSGADTGLIVPIDHGLTVGALPGLRSLEEIKRWIVHPSITGIICHKGMAEKLLETDLLSNKALMIHLNGMSTLSTGADSKIPLTSVESAIRLGADAVSFQVNFDGSNDAANLAQMGSLVDEANRYGLPTLAMVYDKVKSQQEQASARILHLSRIAFELGVSAIKIAPPANLSVIREMSELMPVFLAGGTLVSERDLIHLTSQAVSLGASGLCIGRNIFERDSQDMLAALKFILIGKRGFAPIQEATVAVN